MTKFTKEQLSGIIESADDVLQALAGTHDDIHPDSDKMCEAWNYLNDNAAPPAVVKRLAEIALASLEAEPVMYASNETLAYAKEGEQLLRTLSTSSGDCVIPLYTAPPAPVSVPDEATPENIEILASTFAPRGVTYQWDRDECNAAADSWNACRASMLKGKAEPVSQRDELPYDPQIAAYEKIMEQAIPDGYVLVPVEPTEKMIAAAMSSDDVLFDTEDDTMFRVQHGAIWEVMLAAALPQGGNNAE